MPRYAAVFYKDVQCAGSFAFSSYDSGAGGGRIVVFSRRSGNNTREPPAYSIVAGGHVAGGRGSKGEPQGPSLYAESGQDN